MICPLKDIACLLIRLHRLDTDLSWAECTSDCQLWDKERKDCGLKFPREIKISGGINTHPY